MSVPPELLEHQARHQEFGRERVRLGEVRCGRRVVCAANKVGELIAIGVRHGCPLMVINATAIGMDLRGSEQGFIDQYGVFMTREEARAVALEASQVVDMAELRAAHLYSEDLY